MQAQNDKCYSSTGEELKTDTIVTVSLNLLRQANAKMIERVHLLEIVGIKDNIIYMKDKYINEQQSIIVDFQKRVAKVNSLNESIKNDLDKQKIKTKIAISGGIGIAVGLIICIICK